MLKAKRKKKCKSCGDSFSPHNSTQKACSPRCALDLVEQEKERKAKREAAQRKKENRQKLDALKPRGKHLQEAQQAFNAYIRARDYGKPCISCGARPGDDDLITGSRMDAGHYRSVGSCPELRFEPLNCHAQCVKCNQYLSGNTVMYRLRLVDVLGRDTVEWLEGPHEPKKYTIEDLKRIKTHFREMKRELDNERE